MKKNVAKNEYGYIKSQTRLEILKTSLMFVASIGILLIGMGTTGSKNNFLTIFAVLGLLPAARFLINCIMFFRARIAICNEELYLEIMKSINNTEGELIIPALKFDFYITSYDNCFPILALVVKDKCIIGYTDFPKFNYDKLNEHLKAMAKQNGLELSTVKIFNDKSKFMERISNMEITQDEISDKDLAIIRLLENLSM